MWNICAKSRLIQNLNEKGFCLPCSLIMPARGGASADEPHRLPLLPCLKHNEAGKLHWKHPFRFPKAWGARLDAPCFCFFYCSLIPQDDYK